MFDHVRQGRFHINLYNAESGGTSAATGKNAEESNGVKLVRSCSRVHNLGVRSRSSDNFSEG